MEQKRTRSANVLLVEDDPGDQELVSRALRKGAIDTNLTIVSDGVVALDYLKQEGAYTHESAPTPDLVMLDLNMPKVDGRQVLQRMRSDEQLKRIPVIVLTTSKHELDVSTSYELGCNSFITKPVDPTEFVSAIAEIGHYWFELVTLPVGAKI